MMSLFTSFDMKITLLPFFTFILFLFFMNWSSISFSSMNVVNLILGFIYVFFYKLFNNWKKMSFSLLFNLFFFLFFLNYLSLFPYVFSFTTQFSFIFSISFMMFLVLNLFVFFNNFKKMLIHFIPDGTPLYLIWFLFMIEILSNFIRPFTLTIRLVANIMCGHVMMILLSKLFFLVSFNVFIFYLLITSLEIFVSFMQSYILVILSILYYSEI